MFAGKTIKGRYDILNRLGGGEYRGTYLARQNGVGDRLCVLRLQKPLAPHPENRLVAERLFKREAQIFHQLGKHERAPKLLDEFQDGDAFYLVQEYIDGTSLESELDDMAPAGQPYAAALLREILDALHHFHCTYGPHLNLRPSSFVRRAKDGKLVLVSFGAACQSLLPALETGDRSEYAPREAHKEEPGFHIDLYAAGFIVIRALTGTSPQATFDGRSGAPVWRDAVRASMAFAEIVDRMVNPYFRERYQSVDEVREALAQLDARLRPAVPQARSPWRRWLSSPFARTPSWRRSPRWPWWLVGGTATVAAIGTLLWPQARLATASHRCKTFLEDDRPQTALPHCDRLVALDEDSARAWRWRGDALYDLERYEGAKTAYERSLELDGDDPAIWVALGRAASEAGDRDDATAAFDRAIELAPENVSAWTAKGQALLQWQEAAAALALFEAAVDLDPRAPAAWEGQGDALTALNRPREARQAYSEVLGIYDNRLAAEETPEGWLAKGEVLEALDRPEDALAAYDAAAALDGDLLAPQLAKSTLLFEEERHEDALNAIEAALEGHPDAHLAWHRKGAFLSDRPADSAEAKVKDYKAAIVAFDRALELHPNFQRAWRDKASALLELGRHEDALAAVETALTLDPRDGPTWGIGGTVLYEAERPEKALDFLEKALDLNPGDRVARYYQIAALDALDRADDALDACDVALETAPDFEKLEDLCDGI